MPVIDLVSLIEQTTAFHKIGQANNHLNGVEYWGVCPYCGTGNDRFHVFPEATKPHFWCRICGKTGDHIDILRHFKSLSYVEACEELGVEPGDTILHAAPMFFDDQPPCKEWEDMARTLIERAQRFLWKDKARHALDYLRGRGLTDETIVNAQLGYIPLIDGKWFQSSFSDWGLTDEMLSEKQKAKGCVRVPNGILIPWIADGHIWKLAIKRFEASGDEPKYGQVIGSKDALYGSDSLTRGKPVLLLEGEFDVLSALQEAGDLIIPIGTGSANKLFDMPLWIARIATYASVVLIGFDKDENQAGNMASQQWLQLFANSERWLPYSHDVNDMLQEGKDIRAWIETGLNIATTPQKPPAREEEPFIDCCVGCKRDLNNYDEESEGEVQADDDGNCYCGPCWKKLHETPQPALTCSQCHHETKELREGKCPLCWWKSLPEMPVPEQAKPQFLCKFCKIAKWTWSSEDQDFICIKCYSPASWTQKP